MSNTGASLNGVCGVVCFWCVSLFVALKLSLVLVAIVAQMQKGSTTVCRKVL